MSTLRASFYKFKLSHSWLQTIVISLITLVLSFTILFPSIDGPFKYTDSYFFTFTSYFILGIPIINCALNITKTNLMYSKKDLSDYTNSITGINNNVNTDVISSIMSSMIDLVFILIMFTISLNSQGLTMSTEGLDPINEPDLYNTIIKSIELITTYNNSFFLLIFPAFFTFIIISFLIKGISSLFENKEIIISIICLLIIIGLYFLYLVFLFHNNSNNFLGFINPTYWMIWSWIAIGQTYSIFSSFAILRYENEILLSNLYLIIHSVMLPFIAIGIAFAVNFIYKWKSKTVWRFRW